MTDGPNSLNRMEVRHFATALLVAERQTAAQQDGEVKGLHMQCDTSELIVRLLPRILRSHPVLSWLDGRWPRPFLRTLDLDWICLYCHQFRTDTSSFDLRKKRTSKGSPSGGQPNARCSHSYPNPASDDERENEMAKINACLADAGMSSPRPASSRLEMGGSSLTRTGV